MDFTADIQTEEIQRQTIKILYENLNSEISSRSAGWTTKDDDFYASIGRTSPGYTVEEIADDNFYPGVVPSLIKAPIENYPNCSAYAWKASPLRSSDDTAEEYRITLTIEVMVKSITSELEVNSRIQKTLEAIHAIIIKYPSLEGKVSKVHPPNKTMGDVFVRRESHSRGDRWFWQGGVLEYIVEKYGKLY